MLLQSGGVAQDSRTMAGGVPADSEGSRHSEADQGIENLGVSYPFHTPLKYPFTV